MSPGTKAKSGLARKTWLATARWPGVFAPPHVSDHGNWHAGEQNQEDSRGRNGLEPAVAADKVHAHPDGVQASDDAVNAQQRAFGGASPLERETEPEDDQAKDADDQHRQGQWVQGDRLHHWIPMDCREARVISCFRWRRLLA